MSGNGRFSCGFMFWHQSCAHFSCRLHQNSWNIWIHALATIWKWTKGDCLCRYAYVYGMRKWEKKKRYDERNSKHMISCCSSQITQSLNAVIICKSRIGNNFKHTTAMTTTLYRIPWMFNQNYSASIKQCSTNFLHLCNQSVSLIFSCNSRRDYKQTDWT